MSAGPTTSATVRVLGPLAPDFAWDGTRLYGDLGPGGPVPLGLRGAAASVRPGDAGRWRLLRDPLGLNKLFWSRDAAGAVVVAANPQRLVRAGHPFSAVRSLPRGCVVDLDPAGAEASHSLVPEGWFSPQDEAPQLEAIAAALRSSVSGYLAAVAAAHPGTRAYVCLSGGLDSSGIAALAREHFGDLVAVSFDLQRPGRRASEDRLAAERLCRDLDLPLLTATATQDDLLAHLDTVLVEGIDWRDFNVHAALVNAVLAVAIEESAARDGVRPLVLTGDLANEFLADYHPERYRDTTYYALPRLQADVLRASLVRGLDTSHREVGVFGAWGLPVVQPYAAAVDAYLALPTAFLAQEGHKQHLCRSAFGTLLPGYIYDRPKTRAQVGDPEVGGVLAACVDNGVDGAWLRQRFAALHGVDDPRDLDRFMRAGVYRSAVPTLTELPL